MKVLYLSPLKDLTGYSYAAQNYIRALLSQGIEVVSRPINLSGVEHEIDPVLANTINGSTDGITHVIQHYLPSMFVRVGGVKNIGIFHWETDNFKPSGWQFGCNLMDQIICGCTDTVEACRVSGVTKPVKNIPIPSNLEKYKQKYEAPGIDLKGRYVFYSVADASYRKNLPMLIRAYLAEFSKLDNVALVIKTYMSGKTSDDAKTDIVNLINDIKIRMRKGAVDLFPPIVLITDRMTEDQIYGLHQAGHCYVSVEFGSDWCMPVFDAVGFGNQVIAPNSGGPKDFLPIENLVATEKADCFGMNTNSCPYNDLYTMYEQWYIPRFSILRIKMREAFSGTLPKPSINLEAYSLNSIGKELCGLL